jgi:hypothetical protein
MVNKTYEDWLRQLREDEARLKELEEKGIAALSRYDIEIAYMGDAEMALKSAKQFKRNHIAYDKDRIAELEAKGIQESLFLIPSCRKRGNQSLYLASKYVQVTPSKPGQHVITLAPMMELHKEIIDRIAFGERGSGRDLRYVRKALA